MKLFYKRNGIITVMLVIVLVPVLMASTVLIEMIRFRSSAQLLDMAVMSSAVSALAGYNEDLYSKFGLLAMDGEQDEDVSGWLQANLNLSGTAFTRIVNADGLDIKVDELYALNDVDVLTRQIMEMEKYQGPYNFVEDVVGVAFGVDDLFKTISKQIGKAIPGFNSFKNFTSVVDTAGDAANECITLFENYTEFQTAISEYDTAHSKYINAYNGALDAHSSSYPDGSESSNALDYKHSTINTAEQEYIAAIQDLSDKGTTVFDSLNTVLEKCASTVEGIEKFDVDKQQDDRNAEKKAEQKKINDNTELTEEQKKEKNEEIEENYKCRDAMANSIANNMASQENLFTGVITSAGSFDNNLVKNTFTANAAALINEVTNFNECDLLEGREVTVTNTSLQIVDGKPKLVTTTSTETRYFAKDKLANDAYYKSISTMTDDGLNYVKSVIAKLQEDYQEEELELLQYFDVMKYLFAYITGDGAALSDSIANNVIVDDADNGFQRPGKNMTSSVLTYTTGDETMVNALLDQLNAVRDVMEYDVDSMKPENRLSVATSDVAVETAIDDAISNLTIIGNYIGTVTKAFQGSVLDMMKAIKEFKDCFDAIVKLVDNLTFLSQNLQLLFENVMEKMYQGVMINGYALDHFKSRQDIEPSNRATEALKPIEHTCFKYAETEYIIAGKDSEKENQRNVTLSLYFIRFLANAPVVLLDKNLSQLASSAGYFAPLVFLAFMAIETVLDVIALQGLDCKIPVIKSAPFLSGQTLKEMTTALGGKVKDKAKKSFNEIQAGTDLKDNLNLIEDKFIQPVVEEIFKNDLFKLDYEHYLWIRLCLVSNETKARRIADLIYMEMYKNNQSFKLENQYTYLRVETNAKYATVMPLYNNLKSKELKSVKYCGY